MTADHDVTGTVLTLDAEEAEAVTAAAEGYAAALPPDRAGAYEVLARAAADGAIPDELVDAAQRVIAVRLQAGRAGREWNAAAERVLTAVYRRTPAGRALDGRIQEVNRALSALGDRRLRTAHAAASTPGRYTVTLESEGATVTLTIDATGINIRTLNVG